MPGASLSIDVSEGQEPDDVLQFTVETASSSSLTDLSLYIVPANPKKHRQQSNAPQASAPPRWIRRRVLVQDEIVDHLIDAQSGRTCWSVHRPTRGWYMHLTSPTLPPTVRLDLTSASKIRTYEPGSTPLLLSLTTRLRRAVGSRRIVSSIQDLLEQAPENGEEDAGASKGAQAHRQAHARAPSNPFTMVNLGGPSGARDSYPPGAQLPRQSDRQKRDSADPAASSPEPQVSRATGAKVSHKGHAQRRSTSNPQWSKLAGGMGGLGAKKGFDQPGKVDRQIVGRVGQQAGGKAHDLSAPTPCRFILADGDSVSSGPDRNAPRRKSGSWARKIWSSVPEAIRPPLRLDGSKSFSISWIDAPAECLSAGEEQSHDEAPPAAASQKEVEIVRFEDGNSWWTWDSKLVGTLMIHRKAVEILNLDLAMWIALSASYLDLLQDRDGYNAAYDA